MEREKRKGGEYCPYPPPEKKGWENPSSQSGSIVTTGGCLRQGGFRAGQAFPWPRPPDCPRCHGRIWGMGLSRPTLMDWPARFFFAAIVVRL